MGPTVGLRLSGFGPGRERYQTERKMTGLSRFAANMPGQLISISGRTGISSRLTRRTKQWVAGSAHRSTHGDSSPDNFMIEVLQSFRERIESLACHSDAEGELRDMPFQELIVVKAGFSRVRIPYSAIAPCINPARQFHITLCPNVSELDEPGAVLYFGLIGFVTESLPKDRVDSVHPFYEVGQLPAGKKYVKAIAWDLDNTLWKGILVEDGQDHLSLKPGVIDVVKELDRRES